MKTTTAIIALTAACASTRPPADPVLDRVGQVVTGIGVVGGLGGAAAITYAAVEKESAVGGVVGTIFGVAFIVVGQTLVAIANSHPPPPPYVGPEIAPRPPRAVESMKTRTATTAPRKPL